MAAEAGLNDCLQGVHHVTLSAVIRDGSGALVERTASRTVDLAKVPMELVIGEFIRGLHSGQRPTQPLTLEGRMVTAAVPIKEMLETWKTGLSPEQRNAIAGLVMAKVIPST